MRSRRTVRLIVLVGGVIVLLALASGPAAATITPVKGNCTGNGQFNPGGFKDAASAKVTIPQKAEVVWAGAVVKTPPTAPRAVSGFVELTLPAGQTITIGEWPSSGILVSNSGTYTYDVPSVIAGFEMKFYGEHYEEGELWCKGTVIVEVEGTNPLGVATVPLTVFSLVGSYLTIRRRPSGPTVITEYRKGDLV